MAWNVNHIAGFCWFFHYQRRWTPRCSLVSPCLNDPRGMSKVTVTTRIARQPPPREMPDHRDCRGSRDASGTVVCRLLQGLLHLEEDLPHPRAMDAPHLVPHSPTVTRHGYLPIHPSGHHRRHLVEAPLWIHNAIYVNLCANCHCILAFVLILFVGATVTVSSSIPLSPLVTVF